MIKPIDLFVSKERMKKFVGKPITSLTLLEKELDNDRIDLNLVYDYSRELKGI